MNAIAAPRWMRRMQFGDARLCALDAAGTRYGVFPGGDRRRRPTAKVSIDNVEQARAAGWIAAIGGAFQLTQDGITYLKREAMDNGHADQHREMVDVPVMVEQRIETAKKNLNESPLARWRRPQTHCGEALLNEREFTAGERFRDDYARSSLVSRMTVDWAIQPSGGSRACSDFNDAPISAIAAKDRVMNALDALGAELGRIITDVCIREVGLGRLESEGGWPQRSGKVALKLALGRLADHYGNTASSGR